MPRVSVNDISPSDCERFLELVRGGKSPPVAARELGFPGSGVFGRYAKLYPEFAEAYEEAKGIGLEGYLTKIDRHGEKRALADNATTGDFTAWAKRWHPAWRESTQKIEVSGPAGAPIVVEHKGRLTLGDVASLAAELGHGSSGGDS